MGKRVRRPISNMKETDCWSTFYHTNDQAYRLLYLAWNSFNSSTSTTWPTPPSIVLPWTRVVHPWQIAKKIIIINDSRSRIYVCFSLHSWENTRRVRGPIIYVSEFDEETNERYWKTAHSNRKSKRRFFLSRKPASITSPLNKIKLIKAININYYSKYIRRTTT